MCAKFYEVWWVNIKAEKDADKIEGKVNENFCPTKSIYSNW